MGVGILSRKDEAGASGAFWPAVVRVYLCALAFFLPIMFGCQIMGTEEPNFPLDFLVWMFLGFTPSAPGFLAAHLAGLGLLGAGLVHGRAERQRCPWWVLAWFLLPVLGGTGLVRTTEWDYAFNWLLHFWGAGAFCLAVWWASQGDERLVPWLCNALAAGIAVLCLVGWHQRLGGLAAELEEMKVQHQQQFGEPLPEQIVQKYQQLRINSCFSDPNVFGAHLLALGPVLLLAVRRWFDQTRGARLGTVAMAAVFLLVTLFWTGSRGAVIGLLVGVAAVVWQQPWLQKRRWKWCLPVLACAAVIGFVALVKASKERQGGFASASVRLVYYESALKMACKAPWTGVGLGEFYPEYMRMKPLNAEVSRDAHSFALSCLAQCGIPGLVGMALVCLWPIVVVLRRTRFRQPRGNTRVDDALAGETENGRTSPGDAFAESLLAGGYLAWVTHSFFQFNELIPGTVYLLTLLPIVASHLAPGKQGEDAGIRVHRAVVIVVSCLLILGAFCNLPVAVALQRAEDEKLELMARRAACDKQGGAPVVEAQLKQDLEQWLDGVYSLCERRPTMLAPSRLAWDVLQREALRAETPATVGEPCRRGLLEMATAMTKSAPHRSVGWERLAWAQMLNGDWDEAAKSVEAALTWSPGNGRAMILKAMTAVRDVSCLNLAATVKAEMRDVDGVPTLDITTDDEAARTALGRLLDAAAAAGLTIPNSIVP